jgi:polyisoprenyl-phosphate glycosyltransferase
MSADPRYSVVVPVYNEEESLLELGRRLTAALDELDGASEVLLVDDGSTDATPALLAELERRDERFRVLRLSRNFGHQIAITAGLDAARGAAIVVMDADLQHPPEVIHRLVERWQEGYDVVYAIADEHEQATWFKRRSADLFYRLISRVAKVDMPIGAGDFRLVDRRVRDAFASMRERHRYVRGMFAWIGFRQTGVLYRTPARFGGRSKYTLSAMTRLAADALFSFSQEPLMLVLKVGLGVSVLSFLFGLATLGSKLAGAYNVPGYVSIVVVLAFLGGIQLVVLGFMGQYTARIFEEVKRRPLYLVDDERARPDEASEVGRAADGRLPELVAPE